MKTNAAAPTAKALLAALTENVRNYNPCEHGAYNDRQDELWRAVSNAPQRVQAQVYRAIRKENRDRIAARLAEARAIARRTR